MIRHRRPLRIFAVCLSAVAGFVDAVGFLALGGFFVSFMSGNSTRLGVGLAHRSADAATAGGLIFCFVLGVVLGSGAGRFVKVHRPAAILVMVSALLAAAASFAVLGATAASLALVAAAMGAKNTIFERDGEVSIGVTYMTGTLVKFGQRLAASLLRQGEPLGWLPYLLLWMGLAGGALVGAMAYPHLGLQTLWFAAGAELILAAASVKLEWRHDGGGPPR